MSAERTQEIFAKAIKTNAEAIEAKNEALEQTSKDLDTSGLEVLNDYFEKIKKGEIQSSEKESAIKDALNNHPDTEKLVKYLQKEHGILFETKVEEHGGEGPADFKVVSIGGDEDDVFDGEELSYLDTKSQEVLQKIKKEGLLDIDWTDKEVEETWRRGEIQKIVDKEVQQQLHLFLKKGLNLPTIKKIIRARFKKSIFPNARVEVKKNRNLQANAREKVLDDEYVQTNARVEVKEKIDFEKEKEENRLNKEEAEKDQVISALGESMAKGHKSITDWENAVNKLNYNEAVKKLVMKTITQAKEKLHAVNSILSPAEQTQLGIMNLDINLGASSEAEKFASIFQAISAGIQDEDRKKELKQKVAEKLGIKLKGRPENASELKSQIYLREKAKKEGKVDEETGEALSFDKEHPIEMNESPKVIVYPSKTGYVCEATEIENLGQPIRFEFPKGMPDADLNDRMNRMFIKALFGSHNMSGALEALTGEGQEFTGAVKQNMESKAVGDSDMVEVITQMFLGQRVIQGSRFLKINEMESISDNMRWLVPDGTFGAFNLTDTDNAQKLMAGLGFGNKGTDKMRMKQAGRLFQGQVGAKTYQLLYDEMHPRDKKSGYEKLREKVGSDFVDQYFGVYGGEDSNN